MLRHLVPAAIGLASLLVIAPAALATSILVTATADDMNLGPNGNCTLREAVEAANTNAPVDACPAGSATATDEIKIPAGTYGISIGGSFEDANQTGDFDVLERLVVRGQSAASTVIDANSLDRIFDVRSILEFELADVTLTHGYTNTEFGSAILIWDVSKASILRSTIRDSVPDGYGGGAVVKVFGNFFEIRDSTIRGNGTLSHPNNTYAVIVSSGQSLIENTTVSGNQSSFGPGILAEYEQLTLRHVTLSDNFSLGIDSDLSALYTSVVHLQNTLIEGGCYAAAGASIVSDGGNLESPGNTCVLTGLGDQPNVVSAGLVPLALNGATTDTHEIAASSPAKDAALSTLCSDTDQRGVARPQDAACDVGAFERRPGCIAGIVSTGSGGGLELETALLVLLPLLAARRLRRRPLGAPALSCR